jgi:hypothetical protein
LPRGRIARVTEYNLNVLKPGKPLGGIGKTIQIPKSELKRFITPSPPYLFPVKSMIPHMSMSYGGLSSVLQSELSFGRPEHKGLKIHSPVFDAGPKFDTGLLSGGIVLTDFFKGTDTKPVFDTGYKFDDLPKYDTGATTDVVGDLDKPGFKPFKGLDSFYHTPYKPYTPTKPPVVYTKFPLKPTLPLFPLPDMGGGGVKGWDFGLFGRKYKFRKRKIIDLGDVGKLFKKGGIKF